MFDERSTDAPTSDSIASAKAHQQAERSRVEAATGLRISDDGAIQRPKPRKVACGLCNYTASAMNEGRAINAVAGHIVSQHFPQHVKEGRS